MKKHILLVFSIVVISLSLGFSCQPLGMASLQARAYHGGIALLARPVGMGQAIQDPILDDVAVLVIENVQGMYSIHFGTSSANFDGVLFIKEAFKDKIEIYKTDLRKNNFSFTPGAAIGVSGPGLREIQLLATFQPDEIHGWQDLQAMRLDLEKDYVLKRDIEFPSMDTDIDINIERESNFIPIGTDRYPFKGSINGTDTRNQFSISGLHIKSTENYQGLFGVIEAANADTVVASNLMLEEFTVTGNAYVGSLVGFLKRGTVQEVHIKPSSTAIVEMRDSDTIDEAGYGGGLIGAAGTGEGNVQVYIQNSSSQQKIQISETANNVDFLYVGGLVGHANTDVEIIESYAMGDVQGESGVGGLVGHNEGTVSGYANGSVMGDTLVGGLVGTNVGTVFGYATGSVTGGSRSGGLVGWNGDNSDVFGYAIGFVNGTREVGGLVGLNSNSSNVSGYATGAVTGDDEVGGLVGSNLNTVFGYAQGTVIRNDGTSILFGKTIGSETGTSTSYSSASSSIFTEAGGVNGTEITIARSTQATFVGFAFGTKRGQWTWIANGSWPTINVKDVEIEVVPPVDPVDPGPVDPGPVDPVDPGLGDPTNPNPS